MNFKLSNRVDHECYGGILSFSPVNILLHCSSYTSSPNPYQWRLLLRVRTVDPTTWTRYLDPSTGSHIGLIVQLRWTTCPFVDPSQRHWRLSTVLSYFLFWIFLRFFFEKFFGLVLTLRKSRCRSREYLLTSGLLELVKYSYLLFNTWLSYKRRFCFRLCT